MKTKTDMLNNKKMSEVSKVIELATNAYQLRQNWEADNAALNKCREDWDMLNEKIDEKKQGVEEVKDENDAEQEQLSAKLDELAAKLDETYGVESENEILNPEDAVEQQLLTEIVNRKDNNAYVIKTLIFVMTTMIESNKRSFNDKVKKLEDDLESYKKKTSKVFEKLTELAKPVNRANEAMQQYQKAFADLYAKYLSGDNDPKEVQKIAAEDAAAMYDTAEKAEDFKSTFRQLINNAFKLKDELDQESVFARLNQIKDDKEKMREEIKSFDTGDLIRALLYCKKKSSDDVWKAIKGTMIGICEEYAKKGDTQKFYDSYDKFKKPLQIHYSSGGLYSLFGHNKQATKHWEKLRKIEMHMPEHGKAIRPR